jgi:FkbM family methyltransferase
VCGKIACTVRKGDGEPGPRADSAPLTTNEYGWSMRRNGRRPIINHSPASQASVGVTFSRLRASVRNWYTAGLLAALVMPTRLPPRRGLEETWLGSLVATFRMSDGAEIRCRLKDSGDWTSVYLHEDYVVPLPWQDLRLIVDLGSCVGSFTVWAANRSPNARLVAVEPNPDVLPYLIGNIERNQLMSRVTLIQGAIGDTGGLAAIEDSQARAIEMRVVPISSGKGPTVRLLTLEQLFAETRIEYCDLLKIDCEGAEYDILLGAPEGLLKRIRSIVCEYHPVAGRDPTELLTRLTETGFEVEMTRTPTGLIRAVRIM